MSLRQKIEDHPKVGEWGVHDDSVPDYKYWVLLKEEYHHEVEAGRYKSANTLRDILDFIDEAVVQEESK